MPTTPPLPLPEPEEWAIQLAAQAWCEPETSSVVMDERLAFVFARMLTREADRRSRAPDGFWLAPMEPDEAMQDDAREGDRKYAQRVFGDIMTVQQGPWDHWIAMRDSWLARQNSITAVTTPTEPAARAQGAGDAPTSSELAKMVEEARELLSEALSAAESSGHPLNHSRSKDAYAARDELLAIFERMAGPGR